jgi:hypothetical protein
MALKEIELFVAMNEEGDYEAAAEAEVARDSLNENSGGHCCRIVKLVLKMSPPAYDKPVAEITIPDTAGETVILEAASA